MKLAQALEMSPEKVKRFSWCVWISANTFNHGVTLNDLLADDWEVIEKTVPVTKSTLKSLVNKHIATDFEFNKKFENLCKELGLV